MFIMEVLASQLDFLTNKNAELAILPLSFLYVCMVNTIYFVETPRKFIIAELSIRKLGSSSVLIILIII